MITLPTNPRGLNPFPHSLALVGEYWLKLADSSLKRMLLIIYTYPLNRDLKEACLTHSKSDITSKQKLKERAF